MSLNQPLLDMLDMLTSNLETFFTLNGHGQLISSHMKTPYETENFQILLFVDRSWEGSGGCTAALWSFYELKVTSSEILLAN